MLDLINNVKSGFLLAAFRPVSLWDFCFGKWRATWLFLALIALSTAVEYFSAGLGASVSHDAIPDFLLTLVISLTGFFLIAQFLGFKENGRYIVVALSAVIPVTLISALVESVFQSTAFSSFVKSHDTLAEWVQILLFMVLLVWLVSVIMRTIRVAFLAGKRTAWIFAVIFVLFVSVGTTLLTKQQRLFWAVNNSNSLVSYQTRL